MRIIEDIVNSDIVKKLCERKNEKDEKDEKDETKAERS